MIAFLQKPLSDAGLYWLAEEADFSRTPTALKTQFISLQAHKRDATLFSSMTNLIWWLKPFSSARLKIPKPAFSLSPKRRRRQHFLLVFFHFAPAVFAFHVFCLGKKHKFQEREVAWRNKSFKVIRFDVICREDGKP
jgi:hypothetical protein